MRGDEAVHWAHCERDGCKYGDPDCPVLAAPVPAIVGHPDDGHVFRFEVSSRMSSKVVGEEHHSDADWFGPPHVLHVRAWSLPAAVRKAAELPFSAWVMAENDEW